MKIAIDISQIVYEGTGVGNLVRKLVKHLLKIDKENSYVVFGSSLRRKKVLDDFCSNDLDHSNKAQIKLFSLPPTILDFLWNKLHIAPIEWFIGDVDVFISSDWTQPPTKKAKKATILYDLIVYKYPQETAKKIVETQKRRLAWVKKECDVVFCISKASKQDAMNILAIDEGRLRVINPGM